MYLKNFIVWKRTSKYSFGNARKFIDKVIEPVERLKQFSLSGPNVPESPNLKQVIVQGYRLGLLTPSTS